MLEANLHDKTLTELKVGETRMGKRVRPQGIVLSSTANAMAIVSH